MSELREKLIEFCRLGLDLKKSVVKKALEGLKADLENETKSSAGDKYETGREMINIEWNKLNIQLNDYERQEAVLSRIERKQFSGDQVVLGSIVRTQLASYFIAIPAGELKIGKQGFYAVGIQAPIAQQLLAKRVGDRFDLNGSSQKIVEII